MLWLIRHGETEWSLSGAHTGVTDIPLTSVGEEKARKLGARLVDKDFALVLTSPLQRARHTCELAGLRQPVEVEPNLLEWNYGEYEGLKTSEIRQKVPGWFLFRDGVPGGETIEQVAVRARAVIARVADVKGDVALFAHGHILRILTACWLDLPPQEAKRFALSTASISTLGFEHEVRVISQWNT